MRRSILGLLIAIAAMSLVLTPSHAGQNAGGALLFHANPRLTYTSDTGNYAGLSGASDCAGLVNRKDGSDPVVIHLLAVFAEGAHPSVRGVEFGIDYDASKITILDSGRCGDLEIELPGWPAPGTGTALTFNEPLAASVNEVYWFAAYANTAEPAELRVTGSPRRGGQPAQFGDSTIPAELDDVTLLGTFGFNQNGQAPCPTLVQVVGACCSVYYCTLTTEALCTSHRGQYQGDNSTCEPNPCELRPRCCLEGECRALNEPECTSAGGTYMEELGCQWRSCYTGPRGGCCRDEGRCLLLSEEQCDALGGRYLGDDVACDPVKCPGPVQGACCVPERHCIEAAIDRCISWGGEYKGDGTICDPDPCPRVEPTEGACCVARYDFCVLETEADCTMRTGTFLGLGTVCDPNPCAQHAGACCLRTGECRSIGGAECNLLHGEYRGPDTTCDPNPCAPAERGACCVPDGACYVLDAFSCAQRGRYLGAGTVCDPSPCGLRDQLPGQRSTWGDIKGRFR